MTNLLKRIFPYRDIGWTDIGEEFTRFTLLATPRFTVYLHRLRAFLPHPQCHDHPWSFIAVLLKGGYREFHDGVWTEHKPGTVLFRPAEFSHNVVTTGVSWSLIVTGPKRRAWGFVEQCV